jgi:hypothetical protein
MKRGEKVKWKRINYTILKRCYMLC